MATTAITIEFDPDRLTTYTDRHLAMLWSLALGNAVTPPAARDLVAAVVEAITGEGIELAA